MKYTDTDRIALGTAQFGMNYGIRNFLGQVPIEEVEAILRIAQSVGIRTLDTARAYGAAESVLGELLPGTGPSFSVISKIPPGIYPGTISRHLETSLSMLKMDCIDGYLFHDFSTFKNYPWMWKEIEQEMEQGRIKKAGFSVYYPDELDFLLAEGPDFNMIQLPFNLLDQRFLPSFDALAERGIEIYTRSVFLRGSLFYASDELPPFLEKAKTQLLAVEKIEKETGLAREAILLNFVLNSHPKIKPVIGVDSTDQLNKILLALENKDFVAAWMKTLSELQIQDESILIPYKWEQK